MPFVRPALFSCSIAISLLAALRGQDAAGWRAPPEPIASLVTAEPPPDVSVSPCRRFLLLVHREAMPGIDVLARPHRKLAGLRIDPATRGPQLGTKVTKVALQPLGGGEPMPLGLPAGHLGGPSWSADGERIAFTLTTADAIELWVVQTATRACRRVDGVVLQAVLGSPLEWLPDQKTLLCRMAPGGTAPPTPAAPAGPSVQETGSKKAQVRTTPDLLQNEHDAACFEFFARCQLALVDADSGAVTKVGAPDLIASVDASPDGQYLLVERLRRPFSYLVPWRDFPAVTEVQDRLGKVVRKVHEHGLQEAVPIGGVPEGIRSVSWLPTAPHALRWTEARDGGDPKREVPHRDEVFVLTDLAGAPTSWFKTQYRAAGLTFAEDGRLAVAMEMDRQKRRQRALRVDPGDLAAAPVELYERSSQDAYGDPGQTVSRLRPTGRSYLVQKDGLLWRAGQGASAKGDRPFLDTWDPSTGRTQRVWQSAEGRHETFVGFLGDDCTQILVRSEAPNAPPNWYTQALGGGERVALTRFTDPALQYTTKIRKELLKYERADGVALSGTLYLPPDHPPGQKLPVFVWAYPLEYEQASDAGQVRAAPNRYARLAGMSHLWLLLAGYAVLDDAAMPIVGPSRGANDTFVQQLRMNAEAAVAALVEHGIAEPHRIAVGGHSYGAFMTANLLCHTDCFAAGVARSGAYNRSLTPFGFQNEERTYWEAPAVYEAMSPFANAQRCNEPILLIHGEDDNNQGTYPIQSQRFYHALKGHGATARLVMLPHEAHGYRAKESVLQVLAETIAWLDKYVKNRAVPVPADATPGRSGTK